MKKRLFYLFFTIAFGVGLSSCLDDAADYSMSNTNFAVVKSVENVTLPVAWVENGLRLTWDGISEKHSVGDAMILFYNVNLNDQSNGVVMADPTKINVVESFPLSSQKHINIAEVDTLVENTDNMFESLNLRSFVVTNEFLDDKWLFQAKAKIKKGQRMNLEFYYDNSEGMQHTSIGGALPQGVVVLDVKLFVTGEGDELTSEEKYFVINLSKLRNEIFKNATESGQCNLWLRYYDRSKSETKPSYVQNIGALTHEVSN